MSQEDPEGAPGEGLLDIQESGLIHNDCEYSLDREYRHEGEWLVIPAECGCFIYATYSGCARPYPETISALKQRHRETCKKEENVESPYGRPAACDLIGNILDDHHRSRAKDAAAGTIRCGWSLEMQIYDGLKRAGHLADHAKLPVHCPWDCSYCHDSDGVCEDEDGNPIEEEE